MTVKRKPLSKRTRFEIFKRDGFQCAYCGAVPPKVVLEVDHIIPVSKGGKNEKTNLVTACFDCNRGKSNKDLSSIPSPLITNMEEMKEKEEQMKSYKRLMNSINKRKNKEFKDISDLYNSYFSDYVLSNTFKNSVKKFIDELGFYEVYDSMEYACNRVHDSSDATKYFCGICWGKIKESK